MLQTELEVTINVLFTCQFSQFYFFLTVNKGIKYYLIKVNLYLIKVTLYRTNSIIFPCSPYVKLNVFDHTGVLL